jgi:hypothetical protein
MDGGKKGECCLLVLDSVTSTPQWIRRTKPRARERERERERNFECTNNAHTHTHIHTLNVGQRSRRPRCSSTNS